MDSSRPFNSFRSVAGMENSDVMARRTSVHEAERRARRRERRVLRRLGRRRNRRLGACAATMEIRTTNQRMSHSGYATDRHGLPRSNQQRHNDGSCDGHGIRHPSEPQCRTDRTDLERAGRWGRTTATPSEMPTGRASVRASKRRAAATRNVNSRSCSSTRGFYVRTDLYPHVPRATDSQAHMRARTPALPRASA